MVQILKKRCFGVMLLLAMTACDSRGNLMTTPNMTTLTPELQKLFQKTKPICFGRFIVDMPEDVQVIWGRAQVGYQIHSYPGQWHKVKAEIDNKIAEYKSEKHRSAPSMLLSVQNSVNEHSKIITGYESTTSLLGIYIDAFTRLKLNGYAIHTSDNTEEMDRAIGGILKLTRLLKAREEHDIPTEPGNCIEAGFIPEIEAKNREVIAIGFRFPQYPDVSFSVMTINKDRVDENSSLEYRLQRAKKEHGLEYLLIKFLRQENREVNGWKGYESLARMPSKNGGAHEFRFVSQGEPPSSYVPYIDVTMYTGADNQHTQAKKPSLTDEEAVALWDKLLSSIRVRPTGEAAAKLQPATPPKAPTVLPLGMQISSRDICLQTGIWECAEPVLAYGKRQRRFEAGNRMPVVVVWGEPFSSKWRKWLGLKEEDPVETTWTLVAYDEPSQG